MSSDERALAVAHFGPASGSRGRGPPRIGAPWTSRYLGGPGESGLREPDGPLRGRGTGRRGNPRPCSYTLESGRLACGAARAPGRAGIPELAGSGRTGHGGLEEAGPESRAVARSRATAATIIRAAGAPQDRGSDAHMSVESAPDPLDAAYIRAWMVGGVASGATLDREGTAVAMKQTLYARGSTTDSPANRNGLGRRRRRCSDR